jgi:signal transduction histidine kinase
MGIERAIRLLGYGLYAVAGLVPLCHPGVKLLAQPGWIAAYVVLGLALLVGGAGQVASLAVMTLATMVMAWLVPCPFGALTLVVVASRVALVLSPRVALAWVAAQSAVIAYFLVSEFGWSFGSSQLIALVGFQGFAVVAIASARGETHARLALARTNSALLAARTLLDQATRTQERTRIARDLHDVLGHSLTALGLQLEIASHVGEDAARAQVAKARELTARLLGDVREVVGHMRVDRRTTLQAAIRALIVEVPGLAVHLDVPDSLVVEEPGRAECVAHCIQEIVTNARRHARAQNLWIRLRCEDGEISVEAHDDGEGAEHLRDGHGLRGMRSRMEEMGGWLEVRAAPERAFAISARLPLRSRPHPTVVAP